jgi:hypothetical protein
VVPVAHNSCLRIGSLSSSFVPRERVKPNEPWVKMVFRGRFRICADGKAEVAQQLTYTEDSCSFLSRT